MTAHNISNPRDVHTTALFLAKDVIKDAIRRSGKAISQYKSNDVEKAAKALVASDPEFYDLARIVHDFFARKSVVKFL